jgi:hypothetical protein
MRPSLFRLTARSRSAYLTGDGSYRTELPAEPKITDQIVTLTPAEVGDLQRRIDRFEGAVDALRLLARRSYFPPEQTARISAEADELVQSVEPLWAQRATLSQEALSAGFACDRRRDREPKVTSVIRPSSPESLSQPTTDLAGLDDDVRVLLDGLRDSGPHPSTRCRCIDSYTFGSADHQTNKPHFDADGAAGMSQL